MSGLIRFAATLALLLPAAGMTLAQGVVDLNVVALKKCAGIAQDAKRLRCYDNAVTKTAWQGSAAVSEDRRDTRQDNSQDNSHEKRRDDRTVATVTRVSKRPRGEHVVELDDGSTWEQQFASSYFPVEVGDTVEVKKRRFSGYRLVTESGKGYGVQRVN